ncbi:MAG: HesA/MoeB/ThiF family protein [Desulfobulbaceae bacterium]|nr:HesA/MoeB/ThiF family protein [Desulfobulbaceae bacterium]
MQEIAEFLQKNAEGGLLPFSVQQEAGQRFSLHIAEVEEISLRHDLLPARYQRNRTMISLQQQLSLLRSKVAVFGCGGLGGYIIEELARLGVGRIAVVDPDVFEEHNLNRQLLCTLELLGIKKVVAAEQRVAAVNPAVRLQAFDVAFGQSNSAEILNGVTVAADALDSIPVRLELVEACNNQNIPLVHGAIAGWFGHVAVQYPGENILQHLYAGKKTGHGVEKRLGNPSFTPAAIASLEVAEIVKILLKTEPLLPRRYLAMDLYHMEFTEVFFPDGDRELIKRK